VCHAGSGRELVDGAGICEVSRIWNDPDSDGPMSIFANQAIQGSRSLVV
jgi:hypothetical protein